MNVRPHVAQNTTRRSAVDARTTRHPGYAASQRVRKRIEEAFGWMKTIGGMRRPMLRGIDGWAGRSPLQPQPTILSASRNCWRKQLDRGAVIPAKAATNRSSVASCTDQRSTTSAI